MAQETNRLLVMDDEPKFCTFIEKAAAKFGFEVRSLTDSQHFIETVKEFSPSVLIIDLKMPRCDGIQLLQNLKAAGCQARIFIASGMDQRVLNTAEKLGCSHGLNMLGVLQKPVKLADLRASLSLAMNAGRRYTSDDLRGALDAEELVVYYQPKIAYGDSCWSIRGAEALVRWQHPTDGLLLPGEFIGIAEQSGLIGPLTDYVLQTAIKQLAHWSNRGLNLTVAVNLSARLIEDLTFPDRLRDLLEEHDVPGSKLTLELTESAAMADTAKAMDILLRLRVNDVGLAIDDFGTGFSSLKQLYQLPFDELKIDRTFVKNLPGEEESRVIVRATVEMAHALNMKACAEGVENRGALEYLESIGCDVAQGFLISRAVSAAEFERLVGPWNSQAMRSTSTEYGERHSGRRA